MFTTKSLIGLALLFSCVICSCGFAAPSTNDEHTKEISAPSPAAKIDDADWRFNIIGNLPDNRTAFDISCAKDGFCWFWSSHSIGMFDSSGTWQELFRLDSDDPINRVRLFSSKIAWMIRSSGLYRTNDGGANWQKMAVPALDNREGAIWDVYFRNEQIGWIVGGKYEALPSIPEVNNALSEDRKRILMGCVLTTSDGGKTWQTQDIKTAIGRFIDINFWDDAVGMAFGDAGCILTTDGGRQWTNIGTSLQLDKAPDRISVKSASFINRNQGWVLLGSGEIFVTADAGKSWSTVADSGLTTSENLIEIAFVTLNDGLAISDRLTGGKLFKTTDGGKTWKRILTEEKFYAMSFHQGGRDVLLSDRYIYSLSRD